MAASTNGLVSLAIDHYLAVLREDLSDVLGDATHSGAYAPSLPNQMPFVSVAVEASAPRGPGLGGLVAVKRALIEGTEQDLGYITAVAGACRVSLGLYAAVRPQLDLLRAAVVGIAWNRRARVWEEPTGTLNRSSLLCVRSTHVSLAAPVPFAPAPRLTVRNGPIDLRTGPATAFASLGQAATGDQFELLGRNADGTWVQGCCSNGHAVWARVNNRIELSLPVAGLPLAQDVPRSPRRRSVAGTDSDVATAILATAAVPVATVWRQELQIEAHLEATREPLVSAGERIEEMRMLRRLPLPDDGEDVERVRRFRDREEIVDQFPE